MNYLTENLSTNHLRDSFVSGNDLLDNYLKTQARQDIKRKLSTCFVLTDKVTNNIKGYYTLSSNSIPLDTVPESFKKKLPPSYKNIPVVLLGRLAVSNQYQGQGIGGDLLIDALKRCIEINYLVGAFAVIVDPIDDNAVRFYTKYGFMSLSESDKMFLPIKTVEQVFAS